MKSFLQGKRTLAIAPLRTIHSSAPMAGSTGPAGEAVSAAATAPHIDIVKQGDKIMRIVVTCACGERTEIECLYPPGQ